MKQEQPNFQLSVDTPGQTLRRGTWGWHTPLIDGTEVGIAFDGGDPDRPYIAYAFHDSEHPDVVTRENRSQNILKMLHFSAPEGIALPVLSICNSRQPNYR